MTNDVPPMAEALQRYPGWPMAAAIRATENVLRSYQRAGSSGEDPGESLEPATSQIAAKLHRLRTHQPADLDRIVPWLRKRVRVRVLGDDGESVPLVGLVQADTVLGWPRSSLRTAVDLHRALLIAPEGGGLGVWVWADRLISIEETT